MSLLVQIDEPVLTEVVFAQPKKRRSFMCGALSWRKPKNEELAFAESILTRCLAGLPRERLPCMFAGVTGPGTNRSLYREITNL